ncbi:hypothetical protein [Adonisia turfae]
MKDNLLSGGVGELGPHEQEGFREESPEQPLLQLASLQSMLLELQIAMDEMAMLMGLMDE